ncbi:UDP-N-acetylglucosamine 2-epimerase [Actinokineospora pegani]|uniref:UDP-N-acetylglucosamine 2-epimerase n=1 Tax=Actinokineospora pegani TaxID=2654637 RepID=UPI0012E9B4B2|nr:UDP-N-acetylglucosamine 2-epimerase [Actinokineospora pegani]
MNTLVPVPAQCSPGLVPEVCLVAGDPTSALRLAPVAAAMREHAAVRPVVVACGPRAPVALLCDLGVPADLVLDAPGGVPALLAGFDGLFAETAPHAVLVQGDSATAFSAAMAAFYRKVPVVHLDAGVRSFDLTAPFPQEGHRRLIAQVSSLHLAATPDATANLAEESHTGPKVLTVGSTAVDAGLRAFDRAGGQPDPEVAAVTGAVAAGETRMALLVLHEPHPADELEAVLLGVGDLVLGTPDLEVVLPAAPGGRLRALAEDLLGRLVRVTITDPLPAHDAVDLMARACAVLTDSPTVAEQAPSFGVPALVVGGPGGTWAEPDRPGHPWTAGADRSVLVRVAEKLVSDDRDAATRATGAAPQYPFDNPFGDGRAAQRCEQAVQWLLGLRSRPGEFTPSPPP